MEVVWAVCIVLLVEASSDMYLLLTYFFPPVSWDHDHKGCTIAYISCYYIAEMDRYLQVLMHHEFFYFFFGNVIHKIIVCGQYFLWLFHWHWLVLLNCYYSFFVLQWLLLKLSFDFNNSNFFLNLIILPEFSLYSRWLKTAIFNVAADLHWWGFKVNFIRNGNLM